LLIFIYAKLHAVAIAEIGSDSGRRPTGTDFYEDFLPWEPFPMGRIDLKGEAAGMPFLLFLSAFGFFFSRLLLN
jgi:hypothetical protein